LNVRGVDLLSRDNQVESVASIRMRMRVVWDEGMALPDRSS
jgi:hypothetical protein